MKTLKIDVNSSVNQEIKRKFVEREVLACFSYEMEAILQSSGGVNDAGLASYDDIENLYQYVCPNCGDSMPEIERDQETEKAHCPHCHDEIVSELDQEPQEIFEWWIVTEYLYRQLKKRNEPVLEWGNNCYWGRTTTGQAIMMDGVISSICREMEILDGQKYSWAKHA